MALDHVMVKLVRSAHMIGVKLNQYNKTYSQRSNYLNILKLLSNNFNKFHQQQQQKSNHNHNGNNNNRRCHSNRRAHNNNNRRAHNNNRRATTTTTTEEQPQQQRQQRPTIKMSNKACCIETFCTSSLLKNCRRFLSDSFCAVL